MTRITPSYDHRAVYRSALRTNWQVETSRKR